MEEEVIITASAPDSRKRGIILIVVLFLVVILSVVVFQFEFSTGVEKRIAEHRVGALKASYNLKSKIELAKLSIIRDIPLKAEDPVEQEGEIIEPASAPDPGSAFGIRITDASSRINLNRIVDGRGKPDKAIVTAVEQVFLSIDFDPGLASTIIDFIDKDTKGSDGDPEKQYFINRPLHNLSELALIEDFDPSFFYRGISHDSEDGEPHPPTVYDYFTVFSNGAININTAPAGVLLAIMTQPDSEVIDAIIEERSNSAFKSVADIYKIQGASRGMFGGFERKLTIKPGVFIVEAEDTQDSVTKRARAVFTKTRNKVKMVYYHEE